MLTEEKIIETRKLIGKGIPEGELKNQLLSEGYTEDDLKIIFAPRKYDMRRWLLFFGVLILGAGIYIVVVNNSRSFILIVLGALLLMEFFRHNKKHRDEAERKKDINS